MDPYMVMSARVLHDRRVTESMRRHGWLASSSPLPERGPGPLARLLARIAAQPALARQHRLEKKAAH
jgi:hypothetical protein